MFACKNCGGNVKFDIKSGQLACEYCHSLFDPYAYEDKTSDAEVQKDFDATIFTCPQCGGEILSTDDTAAGFCSFCGASTVLYSRMQKEHKPAYIIPFAKSKDDCKQAYMGLMKKAIFAPKELKDPKYRRIQRYLHALLDILCNPEGSYFTSGEKIPPFRRLHHYRPLQARGRSRRLLQGTVLRCIFII